MLVPEAKHRHVAKQKLLLITLQSGVYTDMMACLCHFVLYSVLRNIKPRGMANSYI